MLPVLYGSYGLLQAMDIVSTKRAIAAGAHEANPLAIQRQPRHDDRDQGGDRRGHLLRGREALEEEPCRAPSC